MNASLPATLRLLESNPFDFSAAADKLFFESFRETAQKHYDNNKIFRGFWKEAGIKPSDVVDNETLARTPPLMVHVFKEWDLCSVPREDIVLRLTSSGTGGQKSQMLLNRGSLDRVKFLAYKIHEALGLADPRQKVNYVCFTYDPKVAKDLGTAFTDELLTSFTGINEVYYTFQWSEAKRDFVFDEKGLIETLKRFEKDSKPVRLLGFPAFLYKVLKENELKFNFGPHSWVQTGGGWKGLADEEIPKHEFRSFVAARLGIPVENIRDLFGMVEHGIPYVDCRLGRMHIPQFARVLIRSPFDLEPLPMGETGLIQFICTYNDSYPAMNILSTDWGRIGNCECGIPGTTLEIRGRAGVTKHKGCAIHALEALA